jgi:flagellar basal-body rod protein FlgG
MNDAFYIGSTGMQTQQKALELIANNITNMNTVGFKRSQVRFSEMVAVPVENNSDVLLNTAQIAQSYGVAMQSSPPVMTQGELRETRVPTDIAVRGSGFIELMSPDGETMLWRGGSLKINEDGFVSASNGMQLKSAISVPEGINNLTIDASGKVSMSGTDNSDAQELGQIDLVTVKDLNSLRSAGDGLYRIDQGTDAIAQIVSDDGSAGDLLQGFQESSNVDLSQEMVTMLLMQRAYAANARVIQAGDELMGIANGLKR